MHPPARLRASLAVLVALTGCALPGAPRPPAAESTASGTRAVESAIQLQGQLSIKLGAFGPESARGMSLGFFLSGNSQTGQLDLMTPLGSQVAQVHWRANQAWLQTTKGEQTFDSLDALSQHILGESLPLGALLHWMQGRPDPELPSRNALDEPARFEQIGWTIDHHARAVGRIDAQRPASDTLRSVQIKIYLDR